MATEARPREELRQMFAELARTGDPRLRDELVEAHLGLASHLSRRFVYRGESYDDLVQVASIALIKAVDRFDPDRGVEFTTFATQTILGELKRHFRDKGWAIRAPRRLQELYLHLNQSVASLSQQLGRSPTIAELAADTGTTEEQVLEALEAGQSYRSTSLDSAGPDEEGLGSRLGVEAKGMGVAEWRTILEPHVQSLPEREQTILRLRFVDCLTQSEIATQIGLSQMHVSRLLVHSLKTLRAKIGELEEQ
ncbi:MAG TPA: SigB/SigF/SigG family RNA polymerase sigma factor [Acidimicrobiales bacterium]